ncbi:MAG: acyltransferase [Bauldia sp.]|nr:acyltransferase [Bauldia sp.]
MTGREAVDPGILSIGRSSRTSALALDIQGLRAVAVFLVVLFHLWPALAPGGFVGVDLFFVISGYLIIGNLLRAADRDGRVAFIPFLAARVRRIVPAVAAVLIVIGLASPLFPATEWWPVAEELPPSALFYENWFLAARAVDYWGRDADPSILQHFWSLGVEFQFYLAAPFLLMGATWLARRSGIPLVRLVIVLLLAVAVASFAISLIETAHDPRRAYFATEARAWEFAIGGLVAVLGLRERVLSRPPSWLSAASLGGIVLIAVAVLALNSERLVPGYALLACAGAALLITGGAATVVGRVLALRPVAWVGGISYGIYLWHWPVIIVWPGDVSDGYGALDGIAIIVASVGLAAVTRWLVEDPIRFSPSLRSRPLRSIGVGLVLAGAAAATAIVPYRLAADRDGEIERLADRRLYPGALALTDGVVVPDADRLPSLSRSERDWPEPYLRGCQADINDAALRTCTYGDPEGRPHVVLIGDSHATQFAAPIIATAQQNGWRYTHMTMGSCPFADAEVLFEGRPYTQCTAWNAAALDELGRLAPDFVVVAQSRSYAFADVPRSGARDVMRDALLRRWDRLIEMGIGVIAIADTPSMPQSSAGCLVSGDASCIVDRPATARQDPVLMAAALEPRVALVDVTDAICGPSTCDPVVGNVLVWMDSNHLTNSYALTMTDLFGRELERAMREAVAGE